jgi:adenylosuccinate synthase
VAVAYDIGGQRVDHLPYHQSDFHAAVPVYEELPGWNTDLSDVTRRDELPAAAESYLRFLEEQVGCAISLVGVGPGREQFVQFS